MLVKGLGLTEIFGTAHTSYNIVVGKQADLPRPLKISQFQVLQQPSAKFKLTPKENTFPFFFIRLKEQYLVTAHVPNFEFWTGCREIKRCEESKRTLKNPFASRLTGFNTTLKLLRITDQ